MKIFKLVTSSVLVLGILALLTWIGFNSYKSTCSEVKIVINCSGINQLYTENEIIEILKKNNLEPLNRQKSEIDLPKILTVLLQQDYVKSVEKVHFLGTKLHLELTLFDVLLYIRNSSNNCYLLSTDGTFLPITPKVRNGVFNVSGYIPSDIRKKEKATPELPELYALYSLCSMFAEDTFYSALYQNITINEHQSIAFTPTIGNHQVVFGTIHNAQDKLKILKYMYEEVLPYVAPNTYSKLDLRFKNRIIATKSNI